MPAASKKMSMNSRDKCVALSIWAVAAAIMVITICFTVYHLKFVDSGLIQQIEVVEVPVKVWIRQ